MTPLNPYAFEDAPFEMPSFDGWIQSELPPPTSNGLLSRPSSTSLFNLLGQQTNNPHWGDLLSLPGAQQVPNIGRVSGLRDLIKQAAQRLGYAGSLDGPSGPQDLAELASATGQDLAALQSIPGPWMKDGDTSRRDAQLLADLRQNHTEKQILDWLQGQGFQVQTVDTGREIVQQLRGPSGEVVSVDAYNYANDNRAVDRLGMAGAALVGGAALYGGMGGVGAGASASGGGTATLSSSLAGATPTVTTASLPTGMTAGLTGGSALGYVPTSAQLWGAGGAAMGAAAGGGGGTATLSPTLAGTSPNLATQGLTASEIGFGSMTPSGGFSAGLTGGEALSTIPAMGGGATGGLLGQLANTGVGKAVGSVADAVGGGRNLAGIVGGLAGAAEGGKSQTSTTTQQIDPRMAQYLYGSGYGDKNSLLGAAQDWWKNNQTGMNANMAQGLDSLKSLYTSPAYSQGYTQMRDVGQGLLGRQIAGNPFTQGGLLGAPVQAPMQPPIQPPRPDIGMPQFPGMQRPDLSLLQGSAMPSPDIGAPQLPRPAWSI